MTIYFHDMFFTEQKGEGTDFLTFVGTSKEAPYLPMCHSFKFYENLHDNYWEIALSGNVVFILGK